MSADIFVPESRPEDWDVGPLHLITLVTADPKGMARMLTEGFGLESDGFVPVAASAAAYLGMPEGAALQGALFTRHGDPGNVRLRVLAVSEECPQVRPAIDGTYVGGLSVGFPMADLHRRHDDLAGKGITSTIGVKEMEFQSPQGETYVSAEAHFTGPENLFFLGVSRPDVFVPVGPIDPKTGIGAPAYSARCVRHSEGVVGFLRDVLGLEIRRDATFAVGERSGLRLQEGSPERFVQAFAPGAATGYLVILDHFEATKDSPAARLGPASRGLAMWTLPTSDLGAVYARVSAATGATVLRAPGVHGSPFLPEGVRSLIVEDPGGFPIELFES
ncbi:MAG: VOC family protein [Pacificimonas sp.]|jgi:hypothetical protein|nr:VOC family protein [Pacificimonas sp.]